MTGDSKTSATLTEEEQYSDDESYQWIENSDSDIDSYLSWEEDSVLSTDLDDDIDSDEEDLDLKKDNRNFHRKKKTNCLMKSRESC